jgi:riboflavin synthase
MFTGLIEALGRVRDVTPIARGVRLDVESSLADAIEIGDSLATNGVCLTVTGREDGVVSADVSPETLRVTSLGRLVAGAPVNLERPLRADARLGGHFVQGHVDGTGEIVRIDQEGEFFRVRIRYPAPLSKYFVAKGSVAVDGISLTVADLASDTFDVQIVPHTWAMTTLSAAKVGDTVNLECDLIGKYVARLAELRLESS